MIRVFYAPLGFSAAEVLFTAALEDRGDAGSFPDFSGILYITHSPYRVRESAEIFHELVTTQSRRRTGCYIPPETATLASLSKKIYSAYGAKRAIASPLIPVILSRLSGRGIGFSSLVAGFIREIKRTFSARDAGEAATPIIDAFRELSIPDPMVNLMRECLDIFRRYEAFLLEHSLADEEDILRESVRYVAARGKRDIAIIDGIFDPDTAEKNLLKELILNAENAFVCLPFDPGFSHLTEGYVGFLKDNFDIEENWLKEGDACERTPKGADRRDTEIAEPLVYYSYPDSEAEVEGIARKIKSRYASGISRNLEKVTVAFPALDAYAPLIERVFRRYGIPYEISRRRALGKRRPFSDLLALLSAVKDNYPRLAFSHFLSSRHFRRIPESLIKWVPLLSLRSGIISGREAWLELLSEGSETVDLTALPERDIGKDLRSLFRKLRPLEEIGPDAPVDEYLRAIEKVLDDLGFLEAADASTDEEKEKSREEKKLFREVMELLSVLRGLHPRGISLADLIDILGHLLNSSFPEEKGAGVRVRDFSEVPGLSPEYLYLGGLTDEAMPGAYSTDYLLPDSVRRKLGFLHLDKYLDFRRFFFALVLRAAGHLHLSYPLMDGDTRHLPSSLLYPGEERQESLPGIFSPEEYLTARGGVPLACHISEIGIAPSALPSPSHLKVTDIDAYRFCPRKFSIERLFRTGPLNLKEYDVEALTLGNVLHKIMERIIPGPMENLDDLRRRAAEVAREVLKERKLSAYWKDLIMDTFIEILPEIYELEREIRPEGYSTSVIEKTISGEPVKGIRLKGKIDRFDRIGDGVQIIDYKTGAAGLNCSQVLKGNENMQLFLYAAMMKSQGYRVDRVGLYSLKDVQVKWCPPKTKRRGRADKDSQSEGGLDAYILASLQFLEKAVDGMRAGDFTAKPLQEYNCRSCHEYPLCPYIQQ